ncbi:OmpA family protein [Paraflavitalea sp. CAU 1676]|uniref:OmpA family protein n=1 Tax=Paraflavitalea sp. CAU 1676 TaxID=3032598 RepID=UPI0023DC79B0|nr:OmpA family protein [Paraflavitalea sp. CAU 1676]MDF2191484.1 OmpA family protein [Paraflavitalea sp. CAU 1676]
MKRLSLLVFNLAMLSSVTVFSQQETKTPQLIKERYTISGGILGAYNLSNMRVGDNNGNIESGDWKSGYAGGLWANFPIGGKVVSIEPQVQYSRVGGKITTPNPSGNLDQTLDYLSVPVLFKWSSKSVALFAGPQFDFLLDAKNKNTDTKNKDSYESSDISLTGGLEFMPHGRISIYARYIHGIKNINKSSSPEYFNQGGQAGIKLKLFGKFVPGDKDADGVIDSKDKCPTVVGVSRYDGCPIPDTDGDGVNDEQDKCPNQTGLAKYQGCPIPDTDGDGINDEEDKCPTVAGTAKYQGCPIPDTDGDGINDEQDKCPNQAGLAKYQGCPIPDTDGDGINDEEDRCPNEPGVPEMKGCKKIEKFEASRVTFASSKSVLTVQGQRELDVVVAFMQRAPEGLKISLIGHTDNTGSDKINNPLSQARADAAKAYLVSKGIDGSRISTEGRGSTEPIATNDTKQGKMQNRRVEVSIQ